MIIEPAKRISDVQEYYFSRKLKQIDAMRAEGKKVINLGIGNPDLPPAPQVIEKLSGAASMDDTHGYQSYIGIPELRKAYAQWYHRFYGVQLDPAGEILPLIGSKEGIMHISMAFVNPGDSVLVPDPGYPTYMSASKLAGANIISYKLHEHLGWQPDFDELEKLDLASVKIMWINYPNMPTGAKATMDFFRKVIAFGRKHNILICNDNPYSFILNDNPQSILSVDGAKEVAIELNSLSKSHNMAGWRMGMVAGSAPIIQSILKVKSNMDSGVFKPLQLAAAEALTLGKEWFAKVNSHYLNRRKIVWKIMQALECRFDPNQVGMFVWARIPDRYTDSEALADAVLENNHVFITPGTIFGEQGRRYIRISLCSNEEMLEKSLERIIENKNDNK